MPVINLGMFPFLTIGLPLFGNVLCIKIFYFFQNYSRVFSSWNADSVSVNRKLNAHSAHYYLKPFSSVLWIRDILVRIRIRRSVPPTNGSGSFFFFCLLLFEGTFSSFSKIKGHKEVTTHYKLRFILLPFCLMIEGTGSESVPMTNGSG